MVKMLKKYERTIVILLIAFLALPMNLFTSLVTVFAEEGGEENVIVYEEYFDDGIKDIVQSGDANLVYVSEKDFDGNENGNALHVTNRPDGDNYHGADLLFETAGLEAGYTYSAVVKGYVDADVEVPSGAEVNLLTVLGYTTVGKAIMVPGESFTFTAEFTVGDEGVDRLRFQSNEAGIGIPFYIGEIVIEEVATPVEKEPEGPFEPVEKFSSDFEDNNIDGWNGQGAELSVVEEEFNSGSKSMKVSGRDDTNQTAAIDLVDKVEVGADYEITAYMKVEDALEDDQLVIMTLKSLVQGSNTDEMKYNWINNKPLSDADESGWIELKGEVSISEPKDELLVYFEVQGSESNYYLDDVTITQTSPSKEINAPDPGDIDEADRVAIFTDFEDESTHESFQGWAARNGHEELSIADIGANESNHSLLVENRQKSSDAAIIEFLDKMYPGYEYKISLYVRLAEGEEDTPLQLSPAEFLVGAEETKYYPPVIDPVMVTSEEWVLLEGTYDVPNNIETLSFYIEEEYVENSDSGVSYYIDDFKAEVFVADYPVQTDLKPLHEIYDGLFHIGNAVESVHFNGRTLELLTHHHNLVTAENVMKPDGFYTQTIDEETDKVVAIEYNDSGPKAFLNSAIENDLLIHGHVLIWHSQSPGLLWGTDTGRKDENGDRIYDPLKDKKQAEENMYEHIENVMRSADAVAGKSIISWDVVNEALDPLDKDWSNPEDWKAKLRATPNVGWLHTVGDDYIYKAFVKAREVADDLGRYDMVLYYNDYNDHVQTKARTIYHMVKDINERYAEENPDDERLLIGGVGMQAHYSTSVNIANVRESLERFIELGVEIGVTELDVGASDGTTLTANEELRQAYFYAQLFDLYTEHATSMSRVTLWGLSDGNTWRPESNPLLFDRNLQAKEAYYAVANPKKFLSENDDPGQITARQGNAAYGTPVMDGEIDEIWESAPVLPINRFQSAHNGATGEARVLWDSENIYVLVHVNDTGLDKSSSEAHQQDSVEVFIDEQNTKTTSYGEGHYQYRVNFDNDQTFNPSRVEGFESRTFVNGTNYTVEMKIPFSTTTLEAGDMIGFDVQINDAANGNRNTVAIWSDNNSGSGWEDPSVFGELTLDPISPEYLQSLIDDLNDRIDNLEGSNSDLVVEIQELEEALREALAGNEGLRDLINSLLARLEALEDRVAELEGEDTETPGTPGEPGQEPGKDDGTPGTGDEDSDPVLVDPDADGDSDDDSTEAPAEETKDGDKLPSTATSLYNYMLIGLLVLLAGAGLAFYSYKRKRA